jgi:hypothetical protein
MSSGPVSLLAQSGTSSEVGVAGRDAPLDDGVMVASSLRIVAWPQIGKVDGVRRKRG